MISEIQEQGQGQGVGSALHPTRSIKPMMGQIDGNSQGGGWKNVLCTFTRKHFSTPGLKSCQGAIGGSGAGGGCAMSRYDAVCSYELYPLNMKVTGEKTIRNEGKPSMVQIAVDTHHTWWWS
eukprot:12217532-Ditylum_brightwellii.AAC.1